MGSPKVDDSRGVGTCELSQGGSVTLQLRFYCLNTKQFDDHEDYLIVMVPITGTKIVRAMKSCGARRLLQTVQR